MPSILNATTTSGLVTSADNSGSLQLQTNNGTTAVTIDTSQNVGIGTTSPATKFHVSGQARIADSSDSANRITIGVGSNAPYGNASISTTTAGLAIVAEGNGNMTFSNNGSERMRITSGGLLLIGTTSGTPNPGFSFDPNGTLSIGNNAAASGFEFQTYRRSGVQIGSVYQNGTTAVLYNTTSDYRLKENIAPMTGALAIVAQLKPCTYTWKVDGSAGQGFIAHELQAVVPDCVAGEKDAVETYIDEEGNEQTRIKPQGIDTSFLVATLTAAIQELKAELDATKAEVQALKGVA